MAKELGFSPKTLMKNQPSPSQHWKLPVKLWIRELHAQRFGSRPRKVSRPPETASAPPSTERDDADSDVPF